MPQRIPESGLVRPVLQALAASPIGFLKTSALIAAMEAEFVPEGEDAEILEGRADTKFSQKVRNLVSHRVGGGGLETMGFATYHKSRRGWQITDAGRAYIAGETA
jgi:hypothetical protein